MVALAAFATALQRCISTATGAMPSYAGISTF